MSIRQPIVAILGHVDHGKTTLADKIRGTAVAEKEAGAITQHSGASEIPIDSIKKMCGKLLEKTKIKVEIPGLLFLDTPGHEAFTSIRKRGSSIADLAILVVDVNEGFKPQTDEALNFLKEFKTPFVVAATKIDKVYGWINGKGYCFSDSFEKQPEHVKEKVDGSLYKLVGQLNERGFESERFDRVEDFKKTVAIVPVSGITGEGVAELLMMLSGLSQNFLKEQLEVEKGEGKGSVLEVRELRGVGITLDVILYDGSIKKGDWIVVAGKEPVVSKVRAIMKPRPLREISTEKEFEHVDSVSAAAGVKIAAPGLDGVVAGSPVRFLPTEEEGNRAKEELMKDFELVEFETEDEGVVVRADTLGSLEALVHMMEQRGLSVKKAEVGAPNRKDILGAESVKEWKNKVIFSFNVPASSDIEQEAGDKGIKIFSSNVIYKIFEEYKKWENSERLKIREESLAKITYPCKLSVLKGFVFRQKDPAIVGVEILGGILKPGVKLKNKEKEIGVVKNIEQDGTSVEKLEAGARGAVAIDGGSVGRNLNEGDVLYVVISAQDLGVLERYGVDVELGKESLDLKK